MRITIGGLPGSGTTTIAKMLAKRLKLKYINAGEIWDQMAQERKINVLKLNLLAERDSTIDRQLDEHMLDYAKKENNILLESRIIGWLCARHRIPAFKIWFKASFEVRARRIKQREGGNLVETKKETLAREKSEAKRYLEYYGIDINNFSIYDFIVDSSKKSPKEIEDLIIKKLKR